MWRPLCFAFCLMFLTAGCSGKRHYSSSLMGYLYPKEQKVVQQGQPVLKLPLKVGIAFVPDTTASGREAFSSWSGHRGVYHALSEAERMDLLASVAGEFRDYDFIENIEIIPSAYLTPKGGFDNLQQVRTMYDIDVIALVSYDQVQHTDEGLLSISYWTVIGAYIFKGEKNSTNTLVDAAVFHIPSKNLLFRAPGRSFVKGRATPVNLNEQLRSDASEGFTAATRDMVANLKIQLGLFEEKVKQQPEKYRIETRSDYRGPKSFGGSLGAFSSIALLIGMTAVWHNDRRRKR